MSIGSPRPLARTRRRSTRSTPAASAASRSARATVSFTSRLNQNLREAKGYTYGAGSRYIFAPKVGFVSATASVRADVTGPSLKEFLAEFKRLGGGDITDPEAAKVSSTRRADIVQSMGSLGGLLSVASAYELNGRPFSALGDDLKTLSALSAKDLNALAANALVLFRLVGVTYDLGPREPRIAQPGARLTPKIEQRPAHVRVAHPRRRVGVPGERRAPRTTTRLVLG